MSDWWSRKLANANQFPRPTVQPTDPQQFRTARNTTVENNYLQEPPTVPPTATHHRTPQSAKQTEVCPDCGSPDYMSAPGSTYMRCFSCGYPLTQSGSGVSSTDSSQAAKAAKQVPTGGYHPTTIIGRVS